MNRTYKDQRPKFQKLWTTIGNSLLLKQMWKNPPTNNAALGVLPTL
ncbi:hypothetical protein HMPREF0742_01981 [Rothia aeria F0184]|uniref:Uncharacterized protein n=2 Tax=Rothia aeria TaxID=172042 RepID=U7V3J1_9MICC|nr:hypothetical protein HMPREF1324_1431 [Rothia aeria F0474]ERT65313.1 hypothetical protein HMPREF0742_01981 [Rothia aeria F0184]